MTYMLIYNNEVIDEFDTEAEAYAMRYEYELAYGSSVTVVIRKKSIDAYKGFDSNKEITIEELKALKEVKK